MSSGRIPVFALALSFVIFVTPASAQQLCGATGVAVQVLGSGGPFAVTNRASTSYLIWRDGRSIVMVDAGGGAFLRFGEAGARLDDLAALAISHLHPDHVSDLPALLWVSERARQKPLKLIGPSGGPQFPDIATFVKRMFDGTTGVFPALAGTLGQAGGNGVALDVTVVDAKAPDASTILKDNDLELTALGVPHMNAPTLAYRVRVGRFIIVFSSDQTGRDPNFVKFAAGADVLVMHFALSTQASAAQAQIHAPPATVGQIARDAKVNRLVLSHLVEGYPSDPGAAGFSLPRLSENVAEVKKYFAGPVVVAEDLQCVALQ